MTKIGKLSAEQFLRDKLESEIATFGDGTTEFHTRDVQHLLQCLDKKDEEIIFTNGHVADLISKINFNAEQQFYELLELCMTRNNASSEERLGYIRKTYKDTWEQFKNKK